MPTEQTPYGVCSVRFARAEEQWMVKIEERLAKQIAVLPWLEHDKVGYREIVSLLN
ncbi:hypothetical protein [Bacillus dakarensis]|uniref:hypothetical protein n=1 Tax=Robertmurraya dakarensis TaxID=1926278 RepID=UPI0012B69BB4|nr:hypothetical protein [Bacillus dakarensis]